MIPTSSRRFEEAGSPWYTALALLLLLGLAIQIVQGDWEGDIWTHAASIRSLMEDPWSPSHPFLDVEAPAHTFTAYHLALALLARALELTPLTVLKVAAGINAVGFLWVFPRFCRLFVNNRNGPVIALLLTLLAWGPDPWGFSGFLHLRGLGLQISYPAMFVTWVGMATLTRLRADRVKPASLVGFALLGALLLNVHPITFGSIAIVAVAIAATERPSSLVPLVSMGAGAILGAVTWPLYDTFELLTGAASNIDNENRAMYRNVLASIYPALPAIALAVADVVRRRINPISFSVLGLALVWVVGWVFEAYTFGRVMAILVLMLHLRITQWLLTIDFLHRRKALVLACIASLVVLGVGAPSLSRAVAFMIPLPLLPDGIAAQPAFQRSADVFSPVPDLVARDDLVLAPLAIAPKIPTFGGKVVAARPMPFVDQRVRREAVMAFFSNPTADELERFSADWVVVETSDASPALLTLGTIAHKDENLIILDTARR